MMPSHIEIGDRVILSDRALAARGYTPDALSWCALVVYDLRAKGLELLEVEYAGSLILVKVENVYKCKK